MDEPWGHDDKWKKPVTKRQILSDSTYVIHLETEKSYRQNQRDRKENGSC